MGASDDSAKSGNSVQSWPGFFAELVKSFLLLRDVFGYALPGGVFLSIGLIYGRISLRQLDALLNPYKPPAWVGLILVLAACYVSGQIMAAIAYIFFDLWKLLVAKGWKKEPANWLTDHPTEVTGDLLELQKRYPEFFVDLSRRETITLFEGATLVALLAGTIVFRYTNFHASTIFFVGGLLLLVEFSTAIPHLRRVRTAVRDAAKLAEQNAAAQKATPASGHAKQALIDLVKACTDAISRL
jgi:hypothetical protein